MQTGAVFHKHSITHLKCDPQLSWGLWEMWGAEHTRRQLCGGAQIRKETVLPIKGSGLWSPDSCVIPGGGQPTHSTMGLGSEKDCFQEQAFAERAGKAGSSAE